MDFPVFFQDSPETQLHGLLQCRWIMAFLMTPVLWCRPDLLSWWPDRCCLLLGLLLIPIIEWKKCFKCISYSWTLYGQRFVGLVFSSVALQLLPSADGIRGYHGRHHMNTVKKQFKWAAENSVRTLNSFRRNAVLVSQRWPLCSHQTADVSSVQTLPKRLFSPHWLQFTNNIRNFAGWK